MATDGVKIIDGDSARYIYSSFEKMYNEGATVETLKEQYEKDKSQCRFLDEEYEICITAYALAFWEIGALSLEMLKEVEDVISKKATVIGWTEEVGERAGKARQQELDKLLKKISNPRARPRKREIEKKPIISQAEQQQIEKATEEAAQGHYTEAATIYEQLLSQNPNLHDARYNYIEMLYEIPKKAVDCPPYKTGDDIFGSEKHKAYAKYIVAHTDWNSIEKHCRYTLTHRDTDRIETNGKKKKKICEWYLRIVGCMSNALRAQQKYAEAIPFIQKRIDFILSIKGAGLTWVVNDYTDIYQCLLMTGDQQQTDAFIQKFLSLYPDLNRSLEYEKSNTETYGIEAFLAI